MRATRSLRVSDEAWARMLELAKKGGYGGRGLYLEALMKEKSDGSDNQELSE